MKKGKTFRAILFVVPVLLLLACSVSGLTAPQGDAQETPTGDILGAGGGADSGGAGANHGAGGGISGGGNVDSIVESVSYGIYMHALVSGTCGAYTNSGGFKNMELEAAFTGMVFMRPMGKGIPGPFGGLHRVTEPAFFSVSPGLYLDGEGEIQNVVYCPVYETEVDTYAVNITSGINPFQAWIGAMSPVASDAPEGVNPTKTPVGGGEAWVMFHIGNAINGGPILEYEVRGDKGQEDEASLGNPVRFITYWNQLMKGEDFIINMTQSDEGETWTWEVRFVPEPIE
jgi:hypothetical protein